MNLLSTQNLVNDHIDGLMHEAEAERLQQFARHAGQTTPASWRRGLGRGVRGLSRGLAAASARLDPTLDRSRHAEGRPLRA
ncbi:MAG: hypothetical protein ACAH65_11510 [Chloroflexota bacterium]